MFYYLQQQHMLKIPLLRLIWNGSYIVLMAIILTIITYRHVEARNYPVLFPYSIDGTDELREFVSKMKPKLAVTFQEIDLGFTLKSKKSDLKIIGIFQSTGSGIERINAYVYTCEIGRCRLFFFLRTLESKVSIELLYKTREMALKSHKGDIVFRTSFPYLALFDK